MPENNISNEQLSELTSVIRATLQVNVEGFDRVGNALAKMDKKAKNSTDDFAKGFKGVSSVLAGLKSDIVSVSKSLSELVIPSSFSGAIKETYSYKQELMGLSAITNRMGIGFGKLSDKMENLSQAANITRVATAKLFKTYHDGARVVSFVQFENILSRVKEMVGSNEEAMGQYIGSINTLAQKYPMLSAQISRLGERGKDVSQIEKGRLEAQIRGLYISGQIGAQEYRNMSAYINGNKQMTAADIERQAKQQEQTKIWQDFQRQVERVKITFAEMLLPTLTKVANWIEKIASGMESFGFSTGKAMLAFVALSVTGKAFGSVMGGVFKGVSKASGKLFMNMFTGLFSGLSGILKKALVGIPGMLKTMVMGGALPALGIEAVAQGGAMFMRHREKVNLAKAKEAEDNMLFDTASRYRKKAARASEGADFLSAAGHGAAIGAVAGSIFGPAGMAIGAGVGGLVGIGVELFKKNKEEASAEAKSKKEGEAIGSQGPKAEYSAIERMKSIGVSGVKTSLSALGTAETFLKNMGGSAVEIEKKRKETQESFETLQKEQDEKLFKKGFNTETMNSALSLGVSLSKGEGTGSEAIDRINKTIAEKKKFIEEAKSNTTDKGEFQALDEQLSKLDNISASINKQVQALREQGENYGELKADLDIIESAQSTIADKQRIQKDLLSAISSLYGAQVAESMALIENWAQFGGMTEKGFDKEIDKIVGAAQIELEAAKAVKQNVEEALAAGGEFDVEKAYSEATGAAKEYYKTMMDSGQATISTANNAEFLANVNKTIYSAQNRASTEVKGAIDKKYATELKGLDLQTQKYQKLISLASNFATGVGASIEVRQAAMSALGQEISVMQQQAAKYAEDAQKASMSGDAERAAFWANAQNELELQILNKKQQQAELGKSMRDGWVNALSAMNTGSDMMTEIIMDASKNTAQVAQLAGVVRSSFSGAVGDLFQMGAAVEYVGKSTSEMMTSSGRMSSGSGASSWGSAYETSAMQNMGVGSNSFTNRNTMMALNAVVSAFAKQGAKNVQEGGESLAVGESSDAMRAAYIGDQGLTNASEKEKQGAWNSYRRSRAEAGLNPNYYKKSRTSSKPLGGEDVPVEMISKTRASGEEASPSIVTSRGGTSRITNVYNYAMTVPNDIIINIAHVEDMEKDLTNKIVDIMKNVAKNVSDNPKDNN